MVTLWQDYHLYRFCLYKNEYDYFTPPDIEMDCGIEMDYIDESDINKIRIMANEARLYEYLPKWKSCMYNYDFGDNWHHLIELSKIHENYDGEMPILLSGSGDAPPEDAGGTDGFLEFKRIINDKNDEDHDEMIVWGKSQNWEPYNFEKAAIKSL